MAVFSKLFAASLAIACSLASPLVERDASVEAQSSPIAERGLPDFTFAGPRNDILRRQVDGANPNYSQDYIAGGANVQFTPNGNSFSVTFNTNSDFVVGRGWQTGDTTPINFGGSFSVSSGVGLLSVYGWSTNPLVEYYIIEDAQNPPQQGTIKGTFTSDGGSYTVWEHQQVNQPCITGNSCTFQQYLSIRNSGRSSGTVTLENHFNQWASYGMNLGALNYQTISVESWGGAGSAQQTVTKGGSGSTTPPGSSSSTPSSTPTTPPSSGSCSAIYGQCGGIGWAGPACCASGTTCQQLNSYFYQCLT